MEKETNQYSSYIVKVHATTFLTQEKNFLSPEGLTQPNSVQCQPLQIPFDIYMS